MSPISMHVIDPLHNLKLEFANHLFNMWTEAAKLNEAKSIHLDNRQKLMKMRTDVDSTVHSI